jgi:hypothetical protein
MQIQMLFFSLFFRFLHYCIYGARREWQIYSKSAQMCKLWVLIHVIKLKLQLTLKIELKVDWKDLFH